ncbi:MAG: response regulator [Bacteroidia bacterium]|nr:response regulator [Bacteroidia bacterium]
MKFLIVDDEKDVEIMFRQKLRKEIRNGDLALAFAFSGMEALNMLRNQTPPDIMYIFSDINMPGMSGIDLLETVKSEFPEIRVSMISAYGDDENYTKAINSGANGFFTKPIDFDSLKKEINEILMG